MKDPAIKDPAAKGTATEAAGNNSESGIRPAPPPAAGRAPSLAPPPPAGMRGSVPPPPATRAPSLAPPPSLPPLSARTGSFPPPLPRDLTPSSARTGSFPPPLPPRAPASSSIPPRAPSLPPAPPPRGADGLQALAKLHAELRAAQIETDRLREQIKGRDAHIAELKGSLAGRVGEFDTLRNELAAKNAQLAALLTTRDSELQAKDLALELKQRELDAMRDRLKVVNTPEQGDDLKRIRGIGPGFEKTLKQHGTTSYAQMAAWTGDDILRIAALLNTQPGRIARGGWIEQAAALTDNPATP